MALPADQLRESIDRLAGGKREANPFTDLGLSVRYAFVELTAGEARRFVIEVTGVAAGSPMEAADVARGDFITRIGDQAVDWRQSALAQLSRERPFTMTVQRGEREVTVTVPAAGSIPAP
jgi:S1-C subfamily serine protease